MEQKEDKEQPFMKETYQTVIDMLNDIKKRYKVLLINKNCNIQVKKRTENVKLDSLVKLKHKCLLH